MDPRSNFSVQGGVAATPIPNVSNEFRLELGYSSSQYAEGAHGQFEERQASYSNPPITENEHSRVKSVHGVIEHQEASNLDRAGFKAKMKDNIIIEEEEAAREVDIGTHHEAMNSVDWYEEKRRSFTPTDSSQGYPPLSPVQEQKFSPRGSSLRSEPSSPISMHGTHPRVQYPGVGHSGAIRPPPRSSSAASERQFPNQQRFNLVDSGPISSPEPRRAVSDSGHAPIQENSTGTFTPPRQRRQQPGVHRGNNAASKYATFEEMGIRGRGIAEVQAEKEDKECIIM